MRARSWILSVLVISSGVMAVAACVGDDPMPSGTGTDGADSGGGGATDSDSSSTDSGSDSGTLEDAGTDAAKRYCDTVSTPIAPTEFFCADFDGVDPVEGWTKSMNPD